MLAHTVHAQVQWGRDLENRKTVSLGLSAGSVFGLDGEVQETTRPIEEVGGRTSGAPPENYSWKELGFDNSFTGVGLYLGKMWQFITLQGHLTYGSPSVRNEADRDYYIGVSEVRFDGVNYDYMVIPEGSFYSGDIDVYSLDLGMLITPVSFGSADSVSFTPALHLGLLLFLADYEVRAGLAQEVTQYENPPRDYVVGGTGSGKTGLVIPSLGLGGEFSLSLTERVRMTVAGHGAFLEYKGSSSSLGASSRNEKMLDVDYKTFRVSAELEWKLNDRVNLLTGIQFQHWTGDAEVEAKDRPQDEILAMREKFDKNVTVEMSSVMALIGLRF